VNRAFIPLSRVIERMEHIDSETLGERLSIESKQSEISRLAGTFNRMLERLDHAFEAEKTAKEQMRRFVADASHELRTPLTSIHGFLEVLLRGAARNPEQLERSLQSMYNESTRLNKLVNHLLQLARMDRSPQLDIQYASLSEHVREMEPQLRLLAPGRKVTFELAQESVHAYFDPDKIKQVVLNLFHNAVQATDPERGRIEVTVKGNEEIVEVTVTDNGIGIAKEELSRIFERFYRVDASRSRLYGGAGLGLAITQSIVDLHKGSIRVGSAPGQGSQFTITLPRSYTSPD